MEVKKSPKADLENKKSVFMLLGLTITLAIILIAFEWTSTDVEISKFEMTADANAEEEIMPVTRQEEVKPPPPPPPPKVADVLIIVEDNTELEDDAPMINTESNENKSVVITKVAAIEEEDEAAAPVFFIVEDMPEFPGGETALRKYIAESVKYPPIAQENGLQGRVYISFVVNSKGQVVDVKVARGVDPNLDKEAMRVFQTMPTWKPGKQRGKAVKVSYTMPINFVLQ